MDKIIIKLNNEVVDHIDLRQGDMKIGRKPGCEIVLDNLAVSGEHANVFTIGADSFTQDLGTTTAPTPSATDVAAKANDQSAAALFVLDGKSSGRRIDITKSVTNLGKTG